VRLLVHHLSV